MSRSISRTLSIITLLFLGRGESTGQPPTETAQKWLKSVSRVQTIELAESVSFWRAGKKVESKGGVLLWVQVSNPLAFAPRNAPPLLFVYGKSVCQVLQSPTVTGVAVLLAPRPADDEPPIVWVAPGMPPEKLDQPTLQHLLRSQVDSKSTGSLPVVLPPADIRPTQYRNLAELEKAVLKP